MLCRKQSVLSIMCLGALVPMFANADILPLNDALQATYTACVGIDDSLADLKKMAGINTAVTAVGTGLGIGATATGFAKATTDVKIEDLLKDLIELEVTEEADTDDSDVDYDALIKASLEMENISQENLTKLDNLTNKSKKLGDWRTGLLASNTATNIVGAAISGTNKTNEDLEAQIASCKKSVKELKDSIIQAKMNGEDVKEAESIAKECGEYEYIDLSSINKRATGAMVSSIIGAGTGFAGTITSGIANSDKIRKNDDADGKKKDLNTASNVLSVGATAASTAATIFNATQIAAVKKVAKVSENCSKVLK